MKNAEIEQAKPALKKFNGRRAVSCESEAVRKIEQSITYMTRHLDEPLQVATLAAQVNVSPSHFFALFKRQTGCAPIDCFIRLRMQQACRLLDMTTLSVKEVAAALGYDDPFYFSRIFKSVNRVAPSEYRIQSKACKDALNHPAPANGFPGSNRLQPPDLDRWRSLTPVLKSLPGTGPNGDAKDFLQNNSILHSKIPNLC